MKLPAFRKWTQEQLYNDYGNVSFSVYTRTKTTPHRSFKMTMGEYLDYMNNLNDDDDFPIWLVDTKIDEKAKPLYSEDTKKFEFYDYMLKQASNGQHGFNNYQFMVGPAKTGVSPHFHNSALNLLVHGEKLWFLFPPAASFFSTKHVHEWFREDLHILNENGIYPSMCRQQPGDLLWAPNLWGHGVIYTKNSIGIAYLYQG